jgi:hypothetical protein
MTVEMAPEPIGSCPATIACTIGPPPSKTLDEVEALVLPDALARPTYTGMLW